MENCKKELEIEIAQEQIKSPILTREQIHFGLTKFRKLDLSTQKGKQTLIDGFVNAIYLFDDYAIITCNYKDGEEKITFEDIENSELGEFINEQKNKPEQGCSDLFAFGDATGFSLGISKVSKPFAIFKNNSLLPYPKVKNESLDKKQTLWAFFVLRSVVARVDLRVG